MDSIKNIENQEMDKINKIVAMFLSLETDELIHLAEELEYEIEARIEEESEIE